MAGNKPWYKEFKWRKNPFFVKSDPNLVGLDKEKEQIMNYIQGGNICFLNGGSGMGKTSLLKWVELKLKGHTPIYIDAEGLDELFDLDTYIKEHRSLWRSLFGGYPRNVVFLLDEAQASDKSLRNNLKLYWEDDNVKAIVFSQTEPIDKFSKALKNRIGNRILQLNGINKENALGMVEMRTRGNNPFSDDAVKLIVEKSDGVPRRILENCERICMKLAKRGMKKRNIDVKDVENVLGKGKTIINVDLDKFKQEEVKEPSKLSPMQRNIMELLEISSRTTQEIAKSLNTSEGSVGKQLSKLSKLRKVRVVDEKRPKRYGLFKG